MISLCGFLQWPFRPPDRLQVFVAICLRGPSFGSFTRGSGFGRFACPRVAPALVVLASRVARALVLFAFSSVARAAAPLRIPDAI